MYRLRRCYFQIFKFVSGANTLIIHYSLFILHYSFSAAHNLLCILLQNHVMLCYLVMIALVMAGALGNIIDCMFYGLMFSESTPWEVATLFPEEGGYAGFFYGKVVDMFYFPLIRNAAGEVLFFRPVFNIADSCITVAVILVLLFYNKDLQTTLQQPKPAE